VSLANLKILGTLVTLFTTFHLFRADRRLFIYDVLCFCAWVLFVYKSIYSVCARIRHFISQVSLNRSPSPPSSKSQISQLSDLLYVRRIYCSPFPYFKQLLDGAFPGTATITTGNLDNPFPLIPTQPPNNPASMVTGQTQHMFYRGTDEIIYHIWWVPNPPPFGTFNTDKWSGPNLPNRPDQAAAGDA